MIEPAMESHFRDRWNYRNHPDKLGSMATRIVTGGLEVT